MKALLWAVIGFLVVMWLLRAKTSSGAASSRQDAGRRGSSGAEPMIPCAYCGVHMPVSEAIITTAGATFCCEEHRLRHAR
jgi:uncharacterized protein